jgi:hypothetical protein
VHEGEYNDLEGFAAVINSRLAADARVARALGFGWLCAGCAIAACLMGLGAFAALVGYSKTISVAPAAERIASALREVFARTEIHTNITGQVSLAPGAELNLAPNQVVKLAEDTSVKLDPNSSVHVVGDLKVDVPQPSKQQLQLDATSGSKELPFTQYTVFKSVAYGSGYVVTGWNFELSDPSHPFYQRCYYSCCACPRGAD